MSTRIRKMAAGLIRYAGDSVDSLVVHAHRQIDESDLKIHSGFVELKIAGELLVVKVDLDGGHGSEIMTADEFTLAIEKALLPEWSVFRSH